MKTDKIYVGDSLELLKKLPDNSIDCVVTSPPYYNVRDYGVAGQIGLENHPNNYVNKIVEVMKECKRVIKETGTIFLNLGDSYFGDEIKSKDLWIKDKQKLLTHYRIAIKCQEELGLILRNDIHWIKQVVNFKTRESFGSSVPCPVKDRLGLNSEIIFFFTKNKSYYFNLDAIRMPYKESTKKRVNFHRKYTPDSPYKGQFLSMKINPLGKNPGDCIIFPLERAKERHIAMFPSIIPEFCISCGCPKNGIVLDPFMGSGTTALVAKRMNRQFIGFELNSKYASLANKRLLERDK
ncbi:Modification methylase MjaV [uncultured archaeon]|nr:Modification methylase MjaV [uncultured archaeon]